MWRKELRCLNRNRTPEAKGSKIDPYEVWREAAPPMLDSMPRPIKSKCLLQWTIRLGKQGLNAYPVFPIYILSPVCIFTSLGFIVWGIFARHNVATCWLHDHRSWEELSSLRTCQLFSVEYGERWEGVSFTILILIFVIRMTLVILIEIIITA